MAHWRLGREAEARAALAKFRQLAEAERWKADKEVARWAQELDALVPPAP